MNIYKSPKSKVDDGSGVEKEFDRSLWVLIPINAYLWWKLYDYVVLYMSYSQYATPMQIATLSLNIPVYAAAIFYIFKVRVTPRMFWKVWILIAIGDEIRMSISGYSGFFDLMRFTGPTVPLYVIGCLYAYHSPAIWNADDSVDTKQL